MEKRKSKVNKGDLSTRRRKRKKFKTSFLLFLVAFILVLGLAALRLQIFRIQKIEISKLETVNQGKIKNEIKNEISGNFFYIIPKDSLFFYPKSVIRKNLEQNFPSLSSLQLTGSIINQTLYVATEEKVTVALWCSGACYNMDYTGSVFASAAGDNQSFIKYEGLILGNPVGKKFSQDFAELAKFAKSIKTLGFPVEKVKIIDENSAEMQLQEGFYIKFLPRAAGEGLLENLKIFIENLKAKNGGSLPNLEYIDARYGNKIFYKLK